MLEGFNFGEKQLRILIDAAIVALKAKKTEVQEGEKEIRVINETISQLKTALLTHTCGRKSMQIKNGETYSDKWQWVKKIEYAIKISEKALTANEIYQFLCDYEDDFKIDKRKVMSSISGTLSAKSGEYDEKKEFVKSKSENGDYAFDIWKEELSGYGYTSDEQEIDDLLPFAQ